MPPDEHRPATNCFLLYIDEAETLTQEPVAGSKRTRSALRSLDHVLSWINSDPLFTLFLSTNFKLRSLVPPTSSYPSARDWARVRVYPPYTELPFDIFSIGPSRLPESYEKMTLDLACTLEVMTRFGRPLSVYLLL